MSIADMHADDEVVVTMSKKDWGLLMQVLENAHNQADRKRRSRIVNLGQRLHRNAEVLTLSWLDRKLAEFP